MVKMAKMVKKVKKVKMVKMVNQSKQQTATPFPFDPLVALCVFLFERAGLVGELGD